MNFIKRIKRGALALLGVAGLMGVSASAMSVAGGKSAAVPDERAVLSRVERLNRMGLDPVGGGFRQRNLTGLEIAAVRTAKRCFPTNRMARSKYVPNGLPCRVTKMATRILTNTKRDVLAQVTS